MTSKSDSRKEGQEMENVRAMLRASRLDRTGERWSEGRVAGEEWAKRRADEHELEGLAGLLAQLDSDPRCGREGFFDDGRPSPYSAAECVFFAIEPGARGDRAMADDFWDCHVGDKHPASATVRGFCEGVLGVWESEEDKIRPHGGRPTAEGVLPVASQRALATRSPAGGSPCRRVAPLDPHRPLQRATIRIVSLSGQTRPVK